MLNKDVFYHDPLERSLVNQGVSRNDAHDDTTLEYEFKTFVCEGKYSDALVRLIRAFTGNHANGDIPAGWVSGFFGSGKSHLVKILQHLWNDTRLGNGSTARNLVQLPSEVEEELTALKTLGQRSGGLHAAGGTLKSGAGNIRLRFLAILFQSLGLPESLARARFVIDLKKEDKWDAFQSAVEADGHDLNRALRRFRGSEAIQQAFLSAYPHHETIQRAGDVIRSEYPDEEEISIEEMISIIEDALTVGRNELPCTLMVLDELQQFIGTDSDRALDVQEVVEACSKKLKGKLMIVGTGQSALNETANLQKLLGRFTIPVALSDTDVETVIRQVALRKKDQHRDDIQGLVNHHEGEIARQLASTSVATAEGDRDFYVSDYPFLPVRNRFWEKTLRSLDSTGTAGQLRTQLRVVHEATQLYADKPLGTVVPGDYLFDQQVNTLVQTGGMQRRFEEIIQEQKLKGPNGPLRSRVCALSFLIAQLPRGGSSDLGIRATVEQIGDLLIENITTGDDNLRASLPAVFDELVEDGVLMKIDDEYLLQTEEGAAWEQEFRGRVGAMKGDQVRLTNEVTRRLNDGLHEYLRNIKIPHGNTGKNRTVHLHIGLDEPDNDINGIPLWVRDGWSETEEHVLNGIRTTPEDKAILFLFVRKNYSDLLGDVIAEELAAHETLDLKGQPSTDDGQAARDAMQSRFNQAERKVTQTIERLIGESKLYLPGGEECNVIDLIQSIKDAAQTVLTNLYPRFSDADYGNWHKVLKRAREGNSNALAAIDFQGNPEDHPVAKAIIGTLGVGKKGTELRKEFDEPPYGWPQDAIDAVLCTLLAAEQIKGEYQGSPVTHQIDIRTLGLATYKAETTTISASQKLKIRKLIQEAGISCTAGEESVKAREYVVALLRLADEAGGHAPLPEKPNDPAVLALEPLNGNNLLLALFNQQDDLRQKRTDWQRLVDLQSSRFPKWQKIQTLLDASTQLGDHAQWQSSADGIIQARSLLTDPDPTSHLLREMEQSIRETVVQAQKEYAAARESHLAEMENHAEWAALDAGEKATRLDAADLRDFEAPDLSTTEKLISSLAQCPLSNWQNRSDALPGRRDNALATLMKDREPQATTVSVKKATIKSAGELDAWLATTKAEIEDQLAKGPVILQ